MKILNLKNEMQSGMSEKDQEEVRIIALSHYKLCIMFKRTVPNLVPVIYIGTIPDEFNYELSKVPVIINIM